MNASLLSFLNRDALKVADLERFHARTCSDPAYVSDVFWALRQLDADRAWRAVRLLKQFAREHALTDEQLFRLASCAGEMTHWAARLNLCQLLAATGFPPAAREVLFPYLTECFSNIRPMIRAWAIAALAHLENHPEYRGAVAAMMRAARADPAGSIQARLRRMGVGKRRKKPQ